MNTASLLPQIFAQLLTQAPVLLVSLAGIIAVTVRRPAGAAWAIAGFALAAALCVAAPVAQTLVISWATSSGLRTADTARAFAVLGFVMSALHAGSLGLLLTAVLVPRAAAESR